MIVAIARELGSGGETVGEAVAARIGAELLDERRIIPELSQRVPLAAEFVEERFERAPSLGQVLMDSLARASAMLPGTEMLDFVWQPEEVIIESYRGLILEYAAAGNVVVIGPGGRGMLGWKPPETPMLTLLLVAGRDWRIDQLARRYAIERDEAARRIKRTDEARIRYQQHYFKSHLYDCAQYDLVLNTEMLGLELATELACTSAARLAGAATR
jgi:cytidylate kinase